VRALGDGAMDSEQIDQALLDFRHTSELALARVRADLGISPSPTTARPDRNPATGSWAR
jgi:hypothetical protein